MSLPSLSYPEKGGAFGASAEAGLSAEAPTTTSFDAWAPGEAALREALRGARLGGCEFHPTTGVLRWTPECAELLGQALNAEPTLEAFLAGAHPAARPPLRRALLAPARRLSHEFRAAAGGDAAARWLCLEGAAEGPDRCFTGVLRDVSEEVRVRSVLWRQAGDLGAPTVAESNSS